MICVRTEKSEELVTVCFLENDGKEVQNKREVFITFFFLGLGVRGRDIQIIMAEQRWEAFKG